MSKKLTKEQIQKGYRERIYDIDSKMFWSVYAREQKQVAKKNEKLFSKIAKYEGYDFANNLKNYEEESNCPGNHIQIFKIVDELPPKHGKYFQDEDAYNLSAYVNQTCNGGYSGDDYAGNIYVFLPKMNKYFYFNYSC